MIGRAVVLMACILSTSCMASSSEWRAYIQRVEQADPETIQALPERIGSTGNTLDAVHTEALTTAMSMALIQDPISVINATAPLEKSEDALTQRFGTSFICSIPGITHFTPVQIEAYFARAEPALELAGPAAAECLRTMRYIMAEIGQEQSQSQMQ